MKNKKIILGLGAITALGAMSMGFVACKKTEPKKDENKDKGGVVYFNDLPDDIQTSIIKKWLADLLKETGTGTNKKNPKNVGQLEKGAKLSNLIAAIEKIDGFLDKFTIIATNDEKNAALEGTSKELKIIKKGADKDKDTHLILKETFNFTIKT